MNYLPLDKLNDAQVRDLVRMYQSEWWTAGRAEDDVRAMLEHCDRVFGFAEPSSGRLAAFARVITDFIYKALVLDVIVDPAHRERGLGKALLDRILGDPRLASVKHVELYCREEMIPFYERFGFEVDPAETRFMRLSRDAEEREARGPAPGT